MAKKAAANQSWVKKVFGHMLVRNIVLAICGLLILGVLTSVMLNFFTRHNKYIDVPDFTGMDIEEARSAGKKASLKIEINDSLYISAYPGGMVLEQTPAVGAQVKSGRRIFVTLNSFRQKMVDIPYVTGYSLRQAKNNLELAGLEIDKIVYKSDMATNNVIEQQYRGRTITSGAKIQAERGSGITLVVGWNAGSRTPTIPKVIGFPLKEAKSRLWEAGLNVGKISYDGEVSLLEEKNTRVYMQTPIQNGRISPGGSVSLMLTLDLDKVEQKSKESDKAAQAAAKIEIEQDAFDIDEPHSGIDSL